MQRVSPRHPRGLRLPTHTPQRQRRRSTKARPSPERMMPRMLSCTNLSLLSFFAASPRVRFASGRLHVAASDGGRRKRHYYTKGLRDARGHRRRRASAKPLTTNGHGARRRPRTPCSRNENLMRNSFPPPIPQESVQIRGQPAKALSPIYTPAASLCEP